MDAPIESRFYKEIIVQIDTLLTDMRTSGGWMGFDSHAVKFIVDAKLAWWEFYEDRNKLRKLIGFALLGDEKYRALSQSETGREQFNAMVPELIATGDILDALTDEDFNSIVKDIQLESKELTAKARKKQKMQLAIILVGMITNLCNYVSLMVHGRSLCQLVDDAKSGDDEAFVLAVQIDRTVLNLPYFRQRMAKAQLGNEPLFLKRLAYRLKNPVLTTKRSHLKLWLAFAILDDEGRLRTMAVDELWDFCAAVGVYDLDEPDSLRKQRGEYLRLQRTSKDI